MDRSENIEQLFHDALALPENARQAFIRQTAGTDVKLASQVVELLQASGNADKYCYWESGATANEALLMTEPGAYVGPGSILAGHYRLLERIGTGGMGVVYRAVRVGDETLAPVALKVLHTPESGEAVARFLQERRILSRLDHPGIARLLDGGNTAEGQPFLVMELVEGKDLLTYVSSSGLSQTGILQLFQKICGAIIYTHRLFIAHRDLKPANIVITADGEPKLLDFGIGTLFDGSALRTRTGLGGLTPEYASPEQIHGEPAGASSDIYTLGVLLYRMLSGHLPYGPQAVSPIQLAHAITSETPPPLSVGEKAADADLQLILSRALRKEPERRYLSAAEFSDDIQKFLDGFPVSARPDTRRYRAKKFMGRNRLTLAAAALVMLAILGGSAAALLQARRAERHLNEVRKLASSLIFEVNDAIADLPGSTSARETILNRGIDYLSRSLDEQGTDRKFGLELADAYLRFALLQGVSQVNLGNRKDALASEKKAEAILLSIVSRDRGDIGAGQRLTNVYSQEANLLTSLGDLRQASEYARKAVALSDGMLKLRTDRETLEATAEAYEAWGDLAGNPGYQNLGDVETALAFYRKELMIRERLVAEDPLDVDRKQPLAGVHTRLGKVYWMANGDDAAGLKELSEAADLSKWIRTHSAANPWREMNVAIRAVNMVPPLLALKRQQEALGSAEMAVDVLETLMKSDRRMTAVRRELATAYTARGRVAAAAGWHSESLRWFERSLQTFQQLIAEQPAYDDDIEYRKAWSALADSQLSLGDADGALKSASEQLAIDRRLLQVCPENASAKENLASASEQSGNAYRLSGNLGRAQQSYEDAIRILREQQAAGKMTRVERDSLERVRRLTVSP